MWWDAPRKSAPPPGWYVLLCLLPMVGCCTPSVPYCPADNTCCSSSGLILTKQIVSDTTVELCRHPVQCTWTNLCELNQNFISHFQGLVNKRLAMHLASNPVPVDPNAPPLDPTILEDCLHRLTGRDLEPTGVRLYPC